MPKICVMEYVRGWGERYDVELWRDDDSGRLVVRAYNECHNGIVDIDLLDIISWCREGPRSGEIRGALEQHGARDGDP